MIHTGLVMMYGINSFANALASSTYISIAPLPSSSSPNHARLRKQIFNSCYPITRSPSTARITHSSSINAPVKNSWHFHPTNFMQNGRVHPPSHYISIAPLPSSFPNHARLRKQIFNSCCPTTRSPSTARITHSSSINAPVKNSWHFHPTNFMQNGRVHPPSHFSLALHETTP